jgi:predicted RNase H-like HicB family nuclease
MIALVTIPLTPIFVEDPQIGGFTAFFKEFPEIITEGETEEIALFNLRKTIYDVYSFKNTQP